MNKALFLDRDGVINIEKHYLYKIEDFEFIEGVFECCQYFQKKGYKIIVVTNQGGIAQGFYTEYDYQKLTRWMVKQFQQKQILLNGVYHCPHHPKYTGECDCRKPKPGMFLKAQQDHFIDLKSSVMVGDKLSDLSAAESAGITNNYLIRTGHDFTIEEERATKNVIDSLLFFSETGF